CDRLQTGTVQQIDQIFVQIVETRFAFESDFKVLAEDPFRNFNGALPLFGEQGIAENKVRLPIAPANVLHLRQDVCGRPRAIRRRDSMRTISAKLRATSAREDRE